MNIDETEQQGSGAAGNFVQSVQPQRDLQSNWAVDLAKNLQEYLLKICSGEITGDDAPPPSINFAEAALLLQGSIQVYSRKVEYLYSLVLHALEFISQKSSQEQTPGPAPEQQEESDPSTAVNEEKDTFWDLDDIPVDPKSLLGATGKDTQNHFVRPPANLVVLEGDCLDSIGDSGELESYLLATSDLYRDFILLDSSDAVTVNYFLHGDNKAPNGKSAVGNGGSSLISKGRKSFQSPIRHSASIGCKMPSRENQNSSPHISPQVNDNVNFDGCHAGSSPDNNNQDFGPEAGYPDSDYSEDSDGVDPWKPLNPHEPGDLKIKPFKRLKTNRRQGVGPKREISLTKEFPLATLHGPISSELTEIWETRRHILKGKNDCDSPPPYEKLRQSLLVQETRYQDEFKCPKVNSEDYDFDSGEENVDAPDFDMPYVDEEIPIYRDEDYGGNCHFDNDNTDGDFNSQANLEDLCRSHMDALLAKLTESEKQTEMAARVSTWKQRIEQHLEEQDSRPPFDIHEYGERVLDKLSLEQGSAEAMSFADIVRGQKKHDVARTFSALLQMVNNGDVDLEKGGSCPELICFTAKNPFHVRLLKLNKKKVNVKPLFSKKRMMSPPLKGHQRGVKQKPGKENQPVNTPPSKSNSSCRFSLRVRKSGSARCTSESKKMKLRSVEPVDMHFAQ